MTPRRDIVDTAADVGRSSVVVAGSFLLTTVLGALLGLVIVLIVGSGERTDAFLAAYSSFYLLLTLFASSLRISLIPLIGAHGVEEPFRAQLLFVVPRVMLIGGLGALAVLGLSPVFGFLLTNGLSARAHRIATLSLVLLAPAGYLQIYSASISAGLGAARRFTVSAGIYALSTAVSLALAVALMPAIGVFGAALGVVGGSLALTVGHITYMRTFDVHLLPRVGWLGERSLWRLAGLVGASAAIGLSIQINLAIALAAVSGTPGEITVYVYAFFLINLVLAISAAALNLVMVPQLVSVVAERGQIGARDFLVKIVPHSFAVLVPLLAAYAAFGLPVLRTVFGDSLTPGEVLNLYRVSIILCGAGVAFGLLFSVHTVTLALGRQPRAAVAAGVGVALQAVLVISLSFAGILAVAAAHSAATILTTVVLIKLTFDGRFWFPAAEALKKAAPAVGFSLVFPLARFPLGSDPGTLVSIVVATLTLAAYAGLVIGFWPEVGGSFKALGGRLRSRLVA